MQSSNGRLVFLPFNMSRLKLRQASDYEYTSTCHSIEGVDDAQEFEDTLVGILESLDAFFRAPILEKLPGGRSQIVVINGK